MIPRAFKVLFGSILGVYILFWVAVIGTAAYFGPSIVESVSYVAEGFMSRVDHTIGYPGDDW